MHKLSTGVEPLPAGKDSSWRLYSTTSMRSDIIHLASLIIILAYVIGNSCQKKHGPSWPNEIPFLLPTTYARVALTRAHPDVRLTMTLNIENTHITRHLRRLDLPGLT